MLLLFYSYYHCRLAYQNSMLFQYIVCELYSMYSISYGVKPIHASAFTNKGNTLYGALDVFSVLHMSIP